MLLFASYDAWDAMYAFLPGPVFLLVNGLLAYVENEDLPCDLSQPSKGPFSASSFHHFFYALGTDYLSFPLSLFPLLTRQNMR
jgi:hypothetical protein